MTNAITRIEGRGLPLRGDDIDTDRIMPARFLVSVSFEGLERHLLEDERAADPAHPFNDRRYQGASILVVNANFGCGSSREHAPQGLVRAGIRAIVGVSFSEIFQGNAAMLGLPCFAAARHAHHRRCRSQDHQRRFAPIGGVASACAARRISQRPVEPDGHAAGSFRRRSCSREPLALLAGFSEVLTSNF